MYNKSISLTLPEEMIHCLSRAEIVTCDLILDLCRCTANNTGTGAFYTCVSQQWLAERLKVTREWISKCVNKLARYGIITITRRRKVNQKWQTNLYRVGDALKKGWKTAKHLLLLAKSRVKLSAHKGTKKYISSTEIRSQAKGIGVSKGDDLKSLLSNILEKLDSGPD